MPLTPPSFALSLSPTEIASGAAKIALLLRSAGEKIIEIQRSQSSVSPTASSLLKAFYTPQDEAAKLQHAVTFPSMVSADAEVRKASGEAKKLLQNVWTEPFSRLDVFAALKGSDASGLSLNEARLYRKTLELFERNGMGLEASQRERFLAMKQDITSLELEFQRNINEDTTELWFSEAELAGVPDDWLQGLPLDTGARKRKVGMKAPDVVTVMQFATNPATRKAVSVAYNSRCRQTNVPILVRLLSLRHQAATLLGYSSWADYRLAACMASTSTNVLSFLRRVLKGVQPQLLRDLEAIRELKAADLGTTLEETKVEVYDVNYYERALRKARYNVDDQAVREYFPTELVIERILGIYEDVFHLKFTQLPDRSLVWHGDVRYYSVHTRTLSDTQGEGDLLGYFALDTSPRPGKYAHQCVVPLVPSLSDTRPVACNVGNLAGDNKETGAKGLMKHGEVRTFFHDYPGGVELDYLECPSQMLENWLWDPTILRRLSSHYVTSEPLPDATVAGLVASRHVLSGYHYSRQIFMSLFDMEVHGRAWNCDTKDELDKSVKEFEDMFTGMQRGCTGIEAVEGTMMAASWYHPAMGYDAGYYSYLWAEVFSHDVFSAFAASPDRCLDSRLGLKYRDTLLRPGANEDANTMLQGFLGREPNEVAFLKEVVG
ncbi:hypothetical protein HDU93_000859 [Gonapodya sp. JEL0774]|nr:hypothetical protein HDU93_000859 [Gonapodya sp. JEL0774]